MKRLVLIAAMLFPLLAQAAEELDAHQRELLLARLEDLAGRLAAKPDDRVPGGFEIRSRRLKAVLKAEQGHRLAGVTLEKTAVILKGEPDMVLAWLDKIRDSRIALTPPFHLRAEGEGFAVQLFAWRIQGELPDPKAADEDLLKLLENLEWFEKQLEKVPGYVAFLKPILDVEAVYVKSAKLEGSVISMDARACDPAAKEAFIKALALRAAELSKNIRLDWKGLKVHPAKPEKGPGMFMRDLDPADALLLAGEAERAQVIAALKPGRPQNGHILEKKGGLLAQVVRKLGLPNKRLGMVTVVADGLSGKPTGAEMFPNRPLSLQFRKVSPANLFVLLSEVSRVGVVPPASGLTLTVLVKSMPIRDLVANVLWTLGLHPNGDEKIFTALPPGTAPAIKKGEPGGLDLSAAEAPLSLLVDALAGRPGVIACGEDPLLTLRVRDASKHNLLELLLTGRGMKLMKSGSRTYLVPEGAGLDPGKCAEKIPAAAVDRMYAVMKEDKQSLALVNDSGRLRWVARGDKLKDGREVRRIRSSRVVLRGADRELTSLFPDVEPDCEPAGCLHRLDPTAKALSRFRLAGTAITQDNAVAALVDEEEKVYLVRKGHLLGRRCGRVSAVEGGRIQVKMGCAQEYDPKIVWISLRGE